MFNFQEHIQHTRVVGNQPIDKPIAGRSDMILNNTDGYVFEASNKLERFLILGTEGGTYYVSEKNLTKDNVKSLDNALSSDPIKAIDTIVDISANGRCIKNDACIFALAYASAHDNIETRRYALSKLNDVCRIGTHLFQFMEYAKYFRGRGHAFNKALKNWYLSKDSYTLGYQLVKYQHRNGWSHRDVLRLCKPKGNPFQSDYFRWAVGKKLNESSLYMPFITGFEEAKFITNELDMIHCIADNKLTREMIPTQWLNNPVIWEVLIENTPYTAMIRNLGVMSACGYLKPLSEASKIICNRIVDKDEIKKSKIHPIAILMALNTYKSGSGIKGDLEWNAVLPVVQALEDAFYLAFDNVVPTHKNMLLCLDVSESMTFDNIGGVPGFTPRDASAVLAMVTMKSEANYHVIGFSHEINEITLHPNMSLDEVIDKISGLRFGSTDIGAAIQYAIKKNLDVDAFVVYTDCEVNRGSHVSELLKVYRKTMNKPQAKLAVVAMTANDCSIADPLDKDMMDFVGFDSGTPLAISSFIGC